VGALTLRHAQVSVPTETSAFESLHPDSGVGALTLRHAQVSVPTETSAFESLHPDKKMGQDMADEEKDRLHLSFEKTY
jgi:hypothetical protein